MEWEMEGMFKREGTYVYLRMIHVDLWQKATQYYKAIILQLKIKFKKELIKKLVYVWSKIKSLAKYWYIFLVTSIHIMFICRICKQMNFGGRLCMLGQPNQE